METITTDPPPYVTPDDLHDLASAAQGPCVSLYLPMERTGKETRGNVIHYKNALHAAEEQLGDTGLPHRDRLHARVDDHAFWQHQHAGLAVFADADGVRSFALEETPEELTFVGDRFHLVPLIAEAATAMRFFVVAVSNKDLRVLDCTRHGFQTIDADRLPDQHDDLKRFLDGETSLQHYNLTVPGSAQAPRMGGRGAPMFHGQGGGSEHDKTRVAEFYQLLRGPLARVVGDRRTPVVFAGVEEQHAIFREKVNTVHVVEPHVQGNFDEVRATAEDIHQQAVDALKPMRQTQRDGLRAWFGSACGAGTCLRDLSEIVPRVDEGRVQALAVAGDARVWGTFDASTRTLQRHDERQPGDQDLLNLAATLGLQRGAEVHVFPRDAMPGNGDAVAVPYETTTNRG